MRQPDQGMAEVDDLIKRWPEKVVLTINRWPTSAGIIRREFSTDPRQIENRSYLANQVIVRNSLFKAE